MSHLLYAILRSDRDLPAPPPCAPDGQRVALIREEGLAAAYSVVPTAYRTPTAPQLLAYAEVIDALHRQATVLPLRYGCLLEGEAQVRDLLRTRREEFAAALDALDDCVEMGLRLLPLSPARSASDGTNPSFLLRAGELGGGAAYLAARRARLEVETARRRQADDIADRLRRTFSSLTVQFAAEAPSPRPAEPLSFHFLVRRADRDRFEELFRRFQAASPNRMLLTGPWPPYHFAAAG